LEIKKNQSRGGNKIIMLGVAKLLWLSEMDSVPKFPRWIFAKYDFMTFTLDDNIKDKFLSWDRALKEFQSFLQIRPIEILRQKQPQNVS
jgi:hypothetical protein